jgi:glucosyl-dolichyl phosphate glucuronosyltransferase
MNVSVIICTYNRAKSLERTLRSLQAQHVNSNVSWELIVVDNNCTDNTRDVVRKFVGLLPIVYIVEPMQGKSRAINRGLRVASGELIVFTDDDVEFYPGWIANFWAVYRERPNGYYFGGPVEVNRQKSELDGVLSRLAPASIRGLDWGNEPRRLMGNEALLGANWACPARALRSTRGADVRIGPGASPGKVRMGTETYLMDSLNEQGMSAWYLPEARVVHFPPASKCSLRYFIKATEAFGHYCAIKSCGVPQGRIILGAPAWVYKKVCVAWMQWAWSRARGRKGRDEYLRFRHFVGTMRGFRELWRSAKGPSPD